MRRKRVAALLTVVLVCTAGCSALTGSNSETPTPSLESEFTHPPGTSPTGVTNGTALYATHAESIRSGSYNHTLVYDTLGEDERALVNSRRNDTVRYRLVDTGDERRTFYHSPPLYAERVQNRKRITFGSQIPQKQRRMGSSTTLLESSSVRNVVLAVNDSDPVYDRTADGTLTVTYSATYNDSTDRQVDGVTVTDYTVTVDEDGVVRHAEIGTATTNPGKVETTYSVDPGPDGGNVPPPDWVTDDAHTFDTEWRQNGTVLAVEPTGATGFDTLTIGPLGLERGNVTMESGETYYLYLPYGEGGLSLEISSTEPATEQIPLRVPFRASLPDDPYIAAVNESAGSVTLQPFSCNFDCPKGNRSVGS